MWSTSAYQTDAAVVAAVFTLVASLSIGPLSWLEAARSVRPSAVLNLYLLISTLFDVVQVRTLWLAGLSKLGTVSSAGLGLKTVLLVLEALPKQLLADDRPAVSNEEKAGIYSLRTFWWINRVLWLGRCQVLKLANLDMIDPGLKTSRYSSALATNWDTSDDKKKYSLLLAVVSTLKWPLLAPSLPRLLLIG